MEQPSWPSVALAALVAAVLWGRSARRLQRVWQRVDDELGPDADATLLARSAYHKELHTVTLYAVIAVATAVTAVVGARPRPQLFFAFLLVPVGLSVVFGRGLPPGGPPRRGPRPCSSAGPRRS